MRVVSGHDRRTAPPDTDAAPRRRDAPPPGIPAVLALQRSVGNVAVSRLLSNRRLQRDISWSNGEKMVPFTTEQAFESVKGASKLSSAAGELGPDGLKAFIEIFDNREFANRNKFIDEIKKDYDRVKKANSDWATLKPDARLKALQQGIAKAEARQGDESLRKHRIITAEATAIWGGAGTPRSILLALLNQKQADDALYKCGLQRRFNAADATLARLYGLLIALANPVRVVKADVAAKVASDLGFWNEIEKPTAENEQIKGFATTLAGLIGELSGLDYAEQSAALAQPGVHSGWRLEDPATQAKYKKKKKPEPSNAISSPTSSTLPQEFREEILEEDVDVLWLDDKGVLHIMESAKDIDALDNKISGPNLAEIKITDGLRDPSQKQRYQALLVRAAEGAVRWGPAKDPEGDVGPIKQDKAEKTEEPEQPKKKKPATEELKPTSVVWYYNIPERDMVNVTGEEFSVFGRVQKIGVSLVVGRTLYTPTTLNELLVTWRQTNVGK